MTNFCCSPVHVKITKPTGFKFNSKQIKNMTTTIQTSVIDFQAKHYRRQSTYLVTVNGEDGNYQEFEIEAANDADAHRKADDIAQQCMIDITYVEVYKMA